MEITTYILLVIIGSAIVTFIPRVVPIALLSRIHIPEWAIHWLKHVPIAVMAALLAGELFLSEGHISIRENGLQLIAAFPTFLIAILTKSLLITVLVGVFSIMLLRFFF